MKVYTIVQQIPFGKVCTYGSIAEALGAKSSSRLVGYALNNAAKDETIPCHRVVNRFGALSGRHHFAGDSMREMLEQENITFIDEYVVDLKKHFWSAS